MELLSAAGIAGIISLSKAVVELATGTKKNKEEIKELKKETAQNARDIEKVASEVQRLRHKMAQSEKDAVRDRAELLTAVKLALIEGGVDYKRVVDLEQKFGKKDPDTDSG